MKIIKILFAIVLVFGVAQASAQGRKADNVYKTTVYAVGVATSFNDSIAYCTEMQELNDTELDRKMYLHRRSGYSFQLRDHLAAQGRQNYTCVILFDANKSKLEKEVVRVKNRFAKDNIKLLEIKESEFKFTKPEELNF